MKLREALNNRVVIDFKLFDGNIFKIPSKLHKILDYLSHRGDYSRVRKQIASINYASKNWNEWNIDKVDRTVDDIIEILSKVKQVDTNFTAIVIDGGVRINIDGGKLNIILQ